MEQQIGREHQWVPQRVPQWEPKWVQCGPAVFSHTQLPELVPPIHLEVVGRVGRVGRAGLVGRVGRVVAKPC